MHPITVTHDWIVSHPVTTMLGLFVVSAIISIYSNQIRSFLHIWPVKTLRSGSRNVSLRRLRTIEYLNKDTYRLVLFIAMSLLEMFRSAVTWYLVIQIGWFICFHKPAELPLWGMFIGIGVGSLFKLEDTLKDLLNFDTASIRLRAEVAEAEAKLAPKPPVA